MHKSIGGYFDLELQPKKHYIFEDFMALNSARNCLEYILTARKYTKIYMPYFTCDVLLEPIKKLNLDYAFYDVDDYLEAMLDFSIIKENEVVLVTNYFGIKSNYIQQLSHKKYNIIVDNAQALFAKPESNCDTIYSPRKFVGVSDGGFLSTNIKLQREFGRDNSFSRMSHLLKRVDVGAEEGYNDFKINDASLENEPIKLMSNLTSKLLRTIDYENVVTIRNANFNFLHSSLKNINKLEITTTEDFVPMVYPYRISNAKEIKKILVSKKIFCATYWPNVFNWCNESKNAYHLAKEIIAIPIDQRYTQDDMANVLFELLNASNHA